MAQIQGTLSHDARVLIWDDTTGALVSDTSESAGSYSVGSLTGDTKIITAIRNSDGKPLTYADVTPVGEIIESYLEPLETNDDGHCAYNGNWANTGTEHRIGHDYPGYFICFYPTVVQGSTIHSCNLTIVTNYSGWNTAPTLYVRFLNADNPAQPVHGNASSKTTFQNTTKTSAITWGSHSNPGGNGVTRTSPELKTILQTVIDRGGWSPGNRLILYIGGPAANIYANEFNGQGGFGPRSYDYGGASIPELYINWEG